MNVATLNQNNNATESVVTPPKMDKILLWYDSSQYKEVSSGNITKLYDRSGHGFTMAQTTTANQPANTALSGKLGGRRVTYFDSFEDRFGSGDNSYLTGTVSLLECFGALLSLNDDPSYTIAWVNSSVSASADTNVFLIEATGATAEIELNEDGAGVKDGVSLWVTSDSAAAIKDECGGNFIEAGVPRVNVLTCEHSSGSSIHEIRSNGVARVWDDLGGSDTTAVTNLGTFSDLNVLTLGVNDDGGGYEGFSYLAEWIFFNAKLTAAETTQLESYLNDKWQVY